jgi:hypothetical protein
MGPINPSESSGWSELSPLKQALLRRTALKAPLVMEEENIARLLEETTKGQVLTFRFLSGWSG